MESIYSATNTATSSSAGMNPVPFDVVTPLINFVSNSDSSGVGGIFNFLGDVWSTFAILAYLVCIGMLIVYVYASTEDRQLHRLRVEILKQKERIYDERFRSGPKNSRFADIKKHIVSNNPNDWKLAIIEADIILDETLKKAGYAGTSLGERLRSISPAQLQSLDDAWQAHKVRNQIAHGGADFILTRRLAEGTIKQYQRVFTELDVA